MFNRVTIRLLDVVLSAVAIVVLAPVLVVLTVLALMDTGSPFFRQVRVGREQAPFRLVKFRTMRVGTRSVATHLVDPSAVTRYGRFLRRTKLDELPQLWNVLKGDMSLVGPRPCLFNQHELMNARARLGVFSVRPGITGLGQIRGIDMATPELLAAVDSEMVNSLTVASYLKYLVLTATGRGLGDRVRSADRER